MSAQIGTDPWRQRDPHSPALGEPALRRTPGGLFAPAVAIVIGEDDHPSSKRERRQDQCLDAAGRQGCPPRQVESRCGAVAVARAYLFPPLSSGGALLVRTWLRFHTPLIEPDMRIARIRLSDKTSRHRPRRAAPKPGQTYEPEVPVEMREWISPASASPDLVFGPQPPAQPHRCVVIERAIGLG